VKVLDMPMKDDINTKKVDIFCSMVIVSEKRSGGGGYDDDGIGEDGNGGKNDGGEDGDGNDEGGEEGNGGGGRDCVGAERNRHGEAEEHDCSRAGSGWDEDESKEQRVMLLEASEKTIDVTIANNINMSEVNILRSMGIASGTG
jgi:hypothetical protein